MNRREFSALLSALVAAPALAAAAEPQAAAPQTAAMPASLPKLASGQYVWGEAQYPQSPRVSHSFSSRHVAGTISGWNRTSPFLHRGRQRSRSSITSTRRCGLCAKARLR